MSKQIHSPVQNKSLGSILKAKREELAITVTQAAETTKIRPEFISALEGGDYSVFASDVYAKGFLKNYATFLGIDNEHVLALYRREQKPAVHSHDLRIQKPKRIDITEKLLSRRGIIVVSAFLLLALAAFYVINQANALLQPPAINITAPVQVSAGFDGEIYVAGNSFKITGNTVAQTVVRMNSEIVALQPNYEFETEEIPIRDSEINLIFTATNQFGRTSTINLEVKKGSTGIATTDKMAILIEIKNEATALIARSDGIIRFNDRAFPGDVITLEARSRLQIESDTPYNITVTINGSSFTPDANSVAWNLVDGNIVKQ